MTARSLLCGRHGLTICSWLDIRPGPHALSCWLQNGADRRGEIVRRTGHREGRARRVRRRGTRRVGQVLNLGLDEQGMAVELPALPSVVNYAPT